MSEQVLSEAKYGLVGPHPKASGIKSVLRGLPLSGDLGAEVREDFGNFTPQTQVTIGEFAASRVSSVTWRKNPVYREATLHLLRELSCTERPIATELSLGFAQAMGRVNDPWIRILASLECCEVSKKEFTRRDMIPTLYLTCFREFEQFIKGGHYRSKRENSIYNLVDDEDKDFTKAKYRAIVQVLQYCEEALKSLWLLEIKDLRSGNTAEYGRNKSNERAMVNYIESWTTFCEFVGGSDTTRDWFRTLQKLIGHSKGGAGEFTLVKPRSTTVNALLKLFEEVQEHIDKAKYREADELVLKIQDGITKKSRRGFDLKGCSLICSYMRARILYFRATQAPGDDSKISEHHARQIVRQGWHLLEKSFHNDEDVWDISVERERMKSKKVLPAVWLVPVVLFPI